MLKCIHISQSIVLSPQHTDDFLLTLTHLLTVAEEDGLYEGSQVLLLPIAEEINTVEIGSEDEHSSDDLVHDDVVRAFNAQV